MILEPLDINILRKFYNLKKNEIVSLWDWIPELFSEVKNNRDKTKCYTQIVRRIKKMKDFFEIKENGEELYTLKSKEVKLIEKYLNSKEDVVIELRKHDFKVYFYSQSVSKSL